MSIPGTSTSLVADIERIIAMDDNPILRNLLITQTYHDLSQGMRRLLGSENINWCTYACWASKTAGRFIRKEEIPQAFRKIIDASDECRKDMERVDRQLAAVHGDARLGREQGLLSLAEKIADEVQAYVIGGNKIVYAELGPVFAKMINTFDGDTSPNDAKLEDFLAQFTIGNAQSDLISLDPKTDTLTVQQQGGQSLLREAIRYYYEAMFEKDPKKKAELIMMANGQTGLHEQIRLQPYIAWSLNSPIRDILSTAHHDALAEWLADRLLRDKGHAVLDRLLAPLADKLQDLWREFATAELMKLKLPDGELKLGHDLPAAPGEPLFPPQLQAIENLELLLLLEQYNAYTDSSQERGLLAQLEQGVEELRNPIGLAAKMAFGSAARDWSKLSERMRYVFEYFRSRQQDLHLFVQPFTDAQQMVILQGQIPEGELY